MTYNYQVGYNITNAKQLLIKEEGIVYETPSIFLTKDDLKNVKNLIAVSGGKSKADAIISTCISGMVDVLITDEGAAFEILKSC